MGHKAAQKQRQGLALSPIELRALERFRQCQRRSGLKWRLKNRAWQLLRNAKFRAKKNQCPMTLTLEHVQVMLDTGKCALTGIKFNTKGEAQWNAPSLDRIVPALGYTPKNTRLVLFALNCAMGSWGKAKLKYIAKHL